jgi:hypothetical protein
MLLTISEIYFIYLFNILKEDFMLILSLKVMGIISHHLVTRLREIYH